MFRGWLGRSCDQTFQEIRVPAFVNQTKEIDRATLNLIADEEGERLRPAAGKAVWANVVAAAPANDFARLPGNALAEGASQPPGDFTILGFFPKQVGAELPAEDRFQSGLPKTSSNVRPESLPEIKSFSR